MLRPAIIALALASACTSVRAQTAEETVAYILHGLENGARGYGETYKQKGKSPAVFASSERVYTISQLSGCKYRILLTFDTIQHTTDVDLTSIKYLDVENQGGVFVQHPEGAVSTCTRLEAGKSVTCNPYYYTIIAQLGDPWPVRSKEALKYFKSTYCKGSAF